MSCNSKQLIHECDGIAGQTIPLMARIKKSDGTYITQATTDSIRVDVYDVTSSDPTPVDANEEEITDGTAYDEPDEADVILNAPLADTIWNESDNPDSIGRNVTYKYTVQSRDKVYEVRMKITATNGDKLLAVWKVTSK